MAVGCLHRSDGKLLLVHMMVKDNGQLAALLCSFLVLPHDKHSTSHVVYSTAILLCCLVCCSNGMPLLIHMTFKDKGQFARHHMLALASWAKENPDHAILMYDDADLEAYLR
jgi:hypothetical protein